MKTFYSYFRGGNGAGVGAELAGCVDLGGVEFDPLIAAACDVNFPNAPTTVADVCAVDPASLLSVAPWWFHASPSCRNASQANSDAGETDEDRDAGQAVARFIRHWMPERFTLENVYQYRTFDAFGYILQALKDCGYSFDYWHLNSADYGVPQTRKRLILIAKRGDWRIQRPEPTHRDGGDWFLPAWNGWYRAIEDIIPTLPESKFAAWQLARLPGEMTTLLVQGANARSEEKGGITFLGCDSPSFTVTAGAKARAFIVDGTPTDHGSRVTVRHSDEPMMTVTANGLKRSTRAFLMRSQNTQQEGGRQVRYGDDPAMTITEAEKPRAFLMSNAATEYGDGIRDGVEPAHSVTTQAVGRTRAWLECGRVVSMNSRALARFQSFPDSYVLPSKTALACKIIGNACCPTLMQKIGETL